MLLIENENIGSFCYKGTGTVNQIKGDIEKLVMRGIEPTNLEVIPVIGKRTNPILFGVSILGIGLITWKIYENIHKRIRKRRG